MKKLLVVVDMQVDFVTGTLGSKEAAGIVPAVAERIRAARAAGEMVVFTQDTHGEDYLNTQEGRNLPVPHCIRGTAGWQLVPELEELSVGCQRVEKPAFGSLELAHLAAEGHYTSIELIGLCTDICVISNAMVLKAALPEVPVAVTARCCAGVTPASHQNALEAMKMCQVSVL